MIEETIHTSLKLINDLFISNQKEMNSLIADLIEKKVQIEKHIEDKRKLAISDIVDIITYLNDIIFELNVQYNIKIPKLTQISTSVKSADYIIAYIIIPIVDTIIAENELNAEISNVEISTSLDLLFIIDITGSMTNYLEEAKNSILSIINGIIEKFPGIDINLGFIGYRDYYEDFIDIDFTQDYSYLKRIINNVYSSGGGWDGPEDVALALEMALNKTWKSNARFAVFVGDNPGHGSQYGGYDYFFGTKPERRSLEEMIAEMAEENISLFCLKINDRTDIMYSIFEDIYNRIKSINTKFMIIDKDKTITPFSDIVIINAVDVYNIQRMDKKKGCLIPEYQAIDILKSSTGINNLNPDENLRFILDKCSPVLLVPGIFATKLLVEINCKGIATKRKRHNFKRNSLTLWKHCLQR